MSTKENLITSLCDQVDQLKTEVEFWKKRFESENSRATKLRSWQVQNDDQRTCDALVIQLYSQTNEDGSVLISKEGRDSLYKYFKTDEFASHLNLTKGNTSLEIPLYLDPHVVKSFVTYNCYIIRQHEYESSYYVALIDDNTFVFMRFYVKDAETMYEVILEKGSVSSKISHLISKPLL